MRNVGNMQTASRVGGNQQVDPVFLKIVEQRWCFLRYVAEHGRLVAVGLQVIVQLFGAAGVDEDVLRTGWWDFSAGAAEYAARWPGRRRLVDGSGRHFLGFDFHHYRVVHVLRSVR